MAAPGQSLPLATGLRQLAYRPSAQGRGGHGVQRPGWAPSLRVHRLISLGVAWLEPVCRLPAHSPALDHDFAEELADDYLVMERSVFIACGPGSEMQEKRTRRLVAI